MFIDLLAIWSGTIPHVSIAELRERARPVLLPGDPARLVLMHSSMLPLCGGLRVHNSFDLSTIRQIIILGSGDCGRMGQVHWGDRLGSDVPEIPHAAGPFGRIVLGVIGRLALPLGRRRRQEGERQRWRRQQGQRR